MAEEMADTDQEDQNVDPPVKSDVELRLEKLEKSITDRDKKIEDIEKASAGKDRKITELDLEKKELQKTTLSGADLLKLREQEFEEREREAKEQNATERVELETLRIKMIKHDILINLDGFPASLSDYVQGTNEEEIETSARRLMNTLVRERGKVDNAGKATIAPRTGGGRKSALDVRAGDVDGMSKGAKMSVGANASDDEFEALITDQQNKK